MSYKFGERTMLRALSLAVICLAGLAGNAWGVTQYTLTELGRDYRYGWAYDVNNIGQVVGGVKYNSKSNTNGFLYQDGTLTLIGSLGVGGYGDSQAKAINDSGQFVGACSEDANIACHAFLYSNGTSTNVTPDVAWYSETEGINNQGQAVGYARKTINVANQKILRGRESLFLTCAW